MKTKIIKIFIAAGAYLAVLYPLWVYGQSSGWSLSSNNPLATLFPIFGLIAFTLLWLHSIAGVFEPWLRRNFNFDSFVESTAYAILICIILHPLLLLLALKFDLSAFFSDKPLYLWLGITGWVLLISYDITKPLKKKFHFFARHWHNVLTISTIGFIFTFFHSLGLGDQLQQGPLRILWIFYGVTGILATIWTYGIHRHKLIKH